MTPDQQARLHDLAEAYVNAQYPGMEIIEGMSDEQCRAAGDEARRLACQFTDLAIELGLHRGGAR